MALPGVFTIKYAKIDNAATSGNSTVVAAVSGKRITILNYALVASGAVSVKFRDGASTDLMGAAALAANGGISFSGTVTSPAFETSVGNALVINASGAVQVSGHVAYIERDK